MSPPHEEPSDSDLPETDFAAMKRSLGLALANIQKPSAIGALAQMPKFDVSKLIGPKTAALDVSKLLGPKTAALDVSKLMGPKTAALDVSKLMGLKTAALDVSKLAPKIEMTRFRPDVTIDVVARPPELPVADVVKAPDRDVLIDSPTRITLREIRRLNSQTETLVMTMGRLVEVTVAVADSTKQSNQRKVVMTAALLLLTVVTVVLALR